MTIKGTEKKDKSAVNLRKHIAKAIHLDNANKTLNVCSDKLVSLGMVQPPVRFRPASLEQAKLKLEACARSVATKTANFLATDIDKLKFRNVGNLIHQLIKFIEASLISYDRLVAKVNINEKLQFDGYLIQFVEMVAELTAAVEEKVRNAENKDWRISQHPDSFDAAINELNYLHSSSQQSLLNTSADSSPRNTQLESALGTWKNWSYAITDTDKSFDSSSGDYSTLVIKSEEPETNDNRFKTTTVIGNNSSAASSLKAQPSNSYTLPDNYFSALAMQWQQSSKRTFFNPRSSNTKAFDTNFNNIVKSDLSDQEKLKELLIVTKQWLTNENNKKTLTHSTRTKQVLKLKFELENKLYLIQSAPETHNNSKILLNQALDTIQNLVNQPGTKLRGGFKKIAHVIARLKDNENAESNIELFRHIQKIAEKRLAGKTLTTFFAGFTRSQTVKNIYQALSKAELICNENGTQPLIDLKDKLEKYLPRNVF